MRETALKLTEIETVLDSVEHAAQDKVGRYEVPRGDIATLKKIANPLKIEVMHEAAFVLGQDWRDLLNRKAAGAARVTVTQFRGWSMRSSPACFCLAAVAGESRGPTGSAAGVSWNRLKAAARARWLGSAPGGLSFDIVRAMRDVLLGADPPMVLTRRATGVLAGLSSDGVGRVHGSGMVVSANDDDHRWWTWAGYRVNATLKATLGGVADPSQRVSDVSIRLRPDLRASTSPSVSGRWTTG